MTVVSEPPRAWGTAVQAEPPAAASPVSFAPACDLALELVTAEGPTDQPFVTLAWSHDLLPLRGHYPGFPIVPGVLLVDTAERATRALCRLDGARWAGITSTRFLRPVFPGDTVTAHLMRPPSTGADGSTTVKCQVRVGGDPAASVTLRFDEGGADRVAGVASSGARAFGTERDALDRDIASVLPHRWPMLLVDRALAVRPGSWLIAEKAVSAQDWVFDGGSTVRGYPWPLAVESWCQSAGVLAAWDRPNPDVVAGDVMLFGGIADISFGEPARPGDVLRHHITLDRDLGDAIMMSGHTTVGERTVMSVGRITMAMRQAGALRRPETEGVTP